MLTQKENCRWFGSVICWLWNCMVSRGDKSHHRQAFWKERRHYRRFNNKCLVLSNRCPTAQHGLNFSNWRANRVTASRGFLLTHQLSLAGQSFPEFHWVCGIHVGWVILNRTEQCFGFLECRLRQSATTKMLITEMHTNKVQTEIAGARKNTTQKTKSASKMEQRKCKVWWQN